MAPASGESDICCLRALLDRATGPTVSIREIVHSRVTAAL
jgi:hypothetical protein